MADLFSALPYVVDLDKPVTKTVLYNLFVTTNKKAHRFIITLRRGGVDVPFTGTVVGTLINYSDMMTQEYPGRAEDGKIVFDWPASFYAKSGLFCVIITVDDGEVSNSVFAAEGSMILGETDILYDPSHVVPSLSELLAQIEATRNAATAANNAADSANSAATDANSAADRANDAAQSIEGMTVSASPGAAADAEITERDGVKHIHFSLQTGATPDITFEVATGAPGTQVQVQQSGTPEAPNVLLTIPRGDTGAVDGIDYFGGSPSALGTASPGTANGVARGDHVHPMPTAEDVGALPMNGTAADADKLGGKAPEFYVQPRNLLDNSDFAMPVNQRGNTSYSNTGYTIDQWKLASGNLSVNDGYVSISRGSSSYAIFAQFTPNVKEGAIYTLAAKTVEGDIAVLSFSFSVGMANKESGFNTAGHTVIARYSAASKMFYVGLSSTTDTPLNVVWIALYEGEYTAETLPPYMPKGYTAELLECQRYFYKSPPGGSIQGNGIVSSTYTVALIAIILPIAMRVTPSIVVVLNGQIRSGGTALVTSEIAVNRMDSNVVLLSVTVGSNLPANQTASLVNTSFELSAEL